LSNYEIRGSFIPVRGQRLFALSHRPVGAARGGVLLVPPFAEEMNKCRRMLAVVARGLAAAGMWVVLPDLLGTGESDGEFSDGSWSVWKQNLEGIAAALAGEGWVATSLLGVRSGAALGLDAAQEAGWSLKRTVLWQPIVDGSRFMTQFLRMRMAASLMDDQRETVDEINRRLLAGELLEVAGYALSAQLAQDMRRVSLSAVLGPQAGKVSWFEVWPDETAGFPPPSAACISGARSKGVNIEAAVIPGDPFWSSTEIVQIPQLVSRTIAALAEPA
jgi:exosortase A-associated hydrolase 2